MLEEFMRYYKFITLSFLLFSVSIAGETDGSHQLSLGRCTNWQNDGPSLLQNLSEHFCVRLLCDEDSCIATPVNSALRNLLDQSYPDYVGEQWVFNYQYQIDKHKDIIFFWLPDPTYPHGGVDAAYSISQGKYLLLKGASVEEINNLLNNSPAFFLGEADILQRAYFWTFLNNAAKRVKPIGSIEEILMRSAEFGIADTLTTLERFRNIIVDMPKIEKKGDFLSVSFYAAIGTELFQMNCNFDKSSLLEYRKKFIGKLPYWY